MEPYLLLVLSLTFIVAVDFLLVCTYLLLVHFESEPTQFWREDHRQSFSPILMILCLAQTVLLIVGFSRISDDMDESYQSIADSESRDTVSQQWKFFCIAIGSITAVGLVILYLAIRRIGTALLSLNRLPLTQIKYFWISHALLDVSAVFAIIISCQELPNEENAATAVKICLILAAFAIVTFEMGFGIWIYAALRCLRIGLPARMVSY